jgi:hypothetical protein
MDLSDDEVRSVPKQIAENSLRQMQVEVATWSKLLIWIGG